MLLLSFLHAQTSQVMHEYCFQWKQHEKELMEEENHRILEFARLQQQREEERMEKQKQQEEEMATVQRSVSTLFTRCCTLFLAV